MLIYLIRHAHAIDGEDDAARPLSPKGKKQIRLMTRFLHRSGRMKTSEFWHSPLVRSQVTARLLAEKLGREPRLLEVSGIEPSSNPDSLAKRLGKVRRSVAVVGHEPHLSAVATLLLAGRAVNPLLVLKKGSVVALERKEGHWRLRWQISPGELKKSTPSRG